MEVEPTWNLYAGLREGESSSVLSIHVSSFLLGCPSVLAGLEGNFQENSSGLQRNSMLSKARSQMQ